MNAQEIQALRERRQKLVTDARALSDTATEEAPLSAEDNQKVLDMLADARNLGATIEREEQLAEEEAVPSLPESQRRTEDDPSDGGTTERREERQRYSEVLDRYLRGGILELDGEQRRVLRQGYRELDKEEKRAMGTIGGPGGGYTVFADTRFGGRVVEALKAFGGVEQAGAEVIMTDTGADLPYVTGDDSANVAEIVGEGASSGHAGGTDISLGQKILRAYLYSTKVIKVSWELLQDSSLDIETYLGNRMGIRQGRGQAAHHVTGTGVNQPEGVQVAAPVGRQAATGNTTSVPADDIYRLKHSVDIAYRNDMLRFMFNDNTALAVQLLKDGQGRYLWQSSLQAGQPDRLAGVQVQINNDMPDMAASVKSILCGDFSYYKIRRVSGLQIVRLDELYVESGQVGFLGFMRADAGFVNPGSTAQSPIKAFQNSAT